MIDYLYLSLYKIFALLARVLPKRAMDGLLRAIAKFAYRFDKRHNHIINVNLKLAFKDKSSQERRDKIGVDVFYNLLQTIIGFMRRENSKKEEILKDIEFIDSYILEEALAEGKKIIFMTAHFGNWELLPIAVALKFNIEMVVVGRKLDSKLMDRVLRRNREKYGIELVYRKGAVKKLLKSLKDGKIVGLLLDQHLGEKQGGVAVDFFGKKALHSPIASILARNLDALIIPIFIETKDYKRYKIGFYRPIEILKTKNKRDDILKMTQAQALITQKVIEQNPNLWFWVHKRWKGFYPKIYD
jgi:KDO2-lipid IV(A) lauroyltransferase